MGMSYEKQKKYLINGNLMTIMEIMVATDLKRSTVQNRILRYLSKNPSMNGKEIGFLFECLPEKIEKKREEESILRYNLTEEAVTRLNSGEDLMVLLKEKIALNLSQKPKPGMRYKARRAYYTLKEKNASVIPPEWKTFPLFLAAVGFPENESDFLWSDHREGNYTIATCFWTTTAHRKAYAKLFCTGRKVTEFVNQDGDRIPVSNLARELGMPYGRLLYRIKKGWPKELWQSPAEENKRRVKLKAEVVE